MKNGFRCLQMNSDNITLTAKTNNFNLEQNNIHIQTYNIIKHRNDQVYSCSPYK